MSAHRDPDTVADYAKNAKMRGLRVIIAGAGLSAALPGVVAAHTELPVIGVPLTSSKSIAGGLDALLSIAQMPPGRAGGLRRRGQREERRGAGGAHTQRVIARYTRPELGAVWTDEARMTAWRDVEVAAAEALEDGPTAADLEAIRGATFTVEAVAEREAVTDHDVAAFVDVLSASAGPGRALDPLRADLLRRARHRARAAAAAGGRADPRAARASSRGALARARARARATRCASGAPTASTPSRRRSGSSSPASPSRRTATPSGSSARSTRPRSARSRARSAPTPRHDPAYEARVLERLGLRAEDVSTQVVPRDRHAELLQAIALAGAGLERFATEIRHLQRTEVREVEEPFRAGPEGLERDAAQAQPDHDRADHRARARAARLRPGGGRERRAVARARHLALRRRARDPARRDDPLDYMQHLALRVVRGMVVHADRMRAQPRAHLRRAVLPARAARAGRAAGWRATTPTGSSSGSAQRAWDTQTPLRELLADEPAAAGARPRRALRLRPLHAPRARGARAPRRDPPAGMSEPLLLRAAPGASADLFHAVPLDIIDPFLYVEVDDRRFAVNSVLERDRIKALGARHRGARPVRARAGRAARRGRRLPRGRARVRPARVPRRSGIEHAIVPPDFPLAWADRLREERRRAARRRRRLRPAPAASRRRRSSPASAAPRPPPTPRWAPRRALLRELPAGLTCEQVREEMQRVCDEHDGELPDDGDRRPRRAGRRRPRGGLRADRARRGRADRHLAARQAPRAAGRT